MFFNNLSLHSYLYGKFMNTVPIIEMNTVLLIEINTVLLIEMDDIWKKKCWKVDIFFEFQAGTRGDVLAEIILDDIIRDTAGELENLERSQRAEQEAIRLQDNPTLENVFQRLEQMEVCGHVQQLLMYMFIMLMLSEELYFNIHVVSRLFLKQHILWETPLIIIISI